MFIGRERVCACTCVEVELPEEAREADWGQDREELTYCISKIGLAHQRQAMNVCRGSEWECSLRG